MDKPTMIREMGMVRHVVQVRDDVAEELNRMALLLDWIDARALRAIQMGAPREMMEALREVRGEIEKFKTADGRG